MCGGGGVGGGGEGGGARGGAGGFWVENGEIQYPVEEITIAGNLKDMLANIVEIGGDVDKRHALHTGSVLLDELRIAGV